MGPRPDIRPLRAKLALHCRRACRARDCGLAVWSCRASLPLGDGSSSAGFAPALRAFPPLRALFWWTPPRRGLLVPLLDALKALLQTRHYRRILLSPVIVNSGGNSYLVGQGPRYLAPLPFRRGVDCLVLEEDSVFGRLGARP